MICFEDGKTIDIDLKELFNDSGVKRVCLVKFDEFAGLSAKSDIKQRILAELNNSDVSKFESHDTFDFIRLCVPEQLARSDNARSLGVYLSKDLLFIVYIPWESHDNINETMNGILAKNPSPAKALVSLLDMFTREDSHVLQGIEEEITDVEDNLITSYKNEYIKDIIGFRKQLLPLKRYYEQLVDLFEEMDENDNEFLNDSELKYCVNISNRADRLYHIVLNLRDYVTQVREAYQSQVDINLNVIMKVFTVITAIFLPLTLIVGWYGMNLQMPEYGWTYGYPAVIFGCVMVVVLCIVLFKKNKWF